MNWKTEIQLIDLGNERKLKVTCTVCSHSQYENPYLLCTKMGMSYDYLDEVERTLTCHKPSCFGSVRIALTSTGETEGFVGGLA
mgnify:CR=1 FL=1|jgi:hypothetical protein